MRERTRRSIRLKGHDYSEPGVYYVTICTRNRECLFGEVIDEAVVLNAVGCEIQRHWESVPYWFPDVGLDEFIVMPNHLHGLIVIVPRDDGQRDVDGVGANKPPQDGVASEGRVRAVYSPLHQRYDDGPRGTTPGSLGAIIQNFKKTSTRSINRVSGARGATVWQRGYYDHIVRSTEELERIRHYIRTNPARWTTDKHNPGREQRDA